MAVYTKSNGNLQKVAGTTTINQERPANTVSFDNVKTALKSNNVQSALEELAKAGASAVLFLSEEEYNAKKSEYDAMDCLILLKED